MAEQCFVHLHNYSSLIVQAMCKKASNCLPEPLDSKDTPFMLYTSGSTGKPKGIYTHKLATSSTPSSHSR